MRVGLAVDGPHVEGARATGNFREGHVDKLLRGLARGRSCSAEEGVVPENTRLRAPLRLAMLIGVLDDDSEAGVACGIVGRSQNPDTGAVHLDIRVYSLAGREGDDSGGPGLRDGVAVERQHVKFVAGKGDGAVF